MKKESVTSHQTTITCPYSGYVVVEVRFIVADYIENQRFYRA